MHKLTTYIQKLSYVEEFFEYDSLRRLHNYKCQYYLHELETHRFKCAEFKDAFGKTIPNNHTKMHDTIIQQTFEMDMIGNIDRVVTLSEGGLRMEQR